MCWNWALHKLVQWTVCCLIILHWIKAIPYVYKAYHSVTVFTYSLLYLSVDVNSDERFCVSITTTPSLELSSSTSSLTITCTVSIDRKALGSPQPYLVLENANGTHVKLELTRANESAYYYTEIVYQTMDIGGVYSCVLKSPLHYLHDEDRKLVNFRGKNSKVSFPWIYADSVIEVMLPFLYML